MTHPHRQEAVDGVGGAVAGVDELLADLVDVADRREASPEAREAAQHGHERPLGDRSEQLLVADVLDLVAVELAQRVAHDLTSRRAGEHGR